MIRNQLKDIWAEGRPALHGWLSIGSPFTAEIMAAQGYDAISIDLQHGALDYSTLLPMFQAMRASGVVLGARVPWLDPAMIMKALDAGALQIICPMINTPKRRPASSAICAIRPSASAVSGRPAPPMRSAPISPPKPMMR